MFPQYDHEVGSSFVLWLDNYLLSQEAYTVKTGEYFQQANSIAGSFVYSAPSAQFVGDSDITGAFVPSGVVVNGSYNERGVSGVKLDFKNGRVYSSIDNAFITGQFTQKDFNIYLSNEQDDGLVFLDEAFNGKDIYNSITGSVPGNYIAPLGLVAFGNSENKPFAIGGTDETLLPFSVMLISDSFYKLRGACSILRDSAYKCFNRIDIQDEPYTKYGDIKDGFYRYSDLVSGLGYDRTLMIDRVRTFPIKKDLNQRRDFFVALVEFDIKDVRQT